MTVIRTADNKGQITIPKEIKTLKGMVTKPSKPVSHEKMNGTIKEKGARGC